MKDAYVYVDGFNFYYGALRENKDCKWLNFRSLFEEICGELNIKTIKYFTAKVRNDPDARRRQEAYLRALGTDSDLEVIEGKFSRRKKNKSLVNPLRQGDCAEPDCPKGDKKARVWISEEKMSDVNLATHLLCDGFLAKYEVAVVVTNDSDLTTPIKLVQQHNDVRVLVICPIVNNRKISYDLKGVASEVKTIKRVALLKKHQFSSPLSDSKGTFHKPDSW